jgi:hypothetical protein
MTELCSTMKNHGSDKGLDWHNYTVLYDHLFQDHKDSIANVFELGLGSQNTGVFQSTMKPGQGYNPGASHRGWRDYFINANVWGGDIDPDILFSEDRIECFQVDQTDPDSIKALWDNFPDDLKFDFILDDGLHTLEGATIFFENSIHKLAPQGIYLIEDVQGAWEDNYLDYFEDVSDNHGMDFEFYRLPYQHNTTDNNIIVICHKSCDKYFDLLDSFNA